jgi:hypothetical protein
VREFRDTWLVLTQSLVQLLGSLIVHAQRPKDIAAETPSHRQLLVAFGKLALAT